MSGYGPSPTSKPRRELFAEIKRFRAKIEAGEPPIVSPPVANALPPATAQPRCCSFLVPVLPPGRAATSSGCRLRPGFRAEQGPLIASSDPRVVDALGDSIDFIWIDNEHTPMSYESLAGHILAAHLHGVAVIVRVQGPNFNGAGGAPWGWSIKAALDSGADGIIVPQVRTVDEVRSIVSDCRYPTGPNRAPPFDKKQTGPSTELDYRKRGMGHMIASNYHREEFYNYTAEADKNIYVVMQVRTLLRARAAEVRGDDWFDDALTPAPVT